MRYRAIFWASKPVRRPVAAGTFRRAPGREIEDYGVARHCSVLFLDTGNYLNASPLHLAPIPALVLICPSSNRQQMQTTVSLSE